MRLTLLCGANPLVSKRGPSVRLQAGRWKLHLEGVKGSTLVLEMESTSERMSVQHDAEFVLETSEIVRVDWIERGRESFINILAERVA